jgi:cytochrome c-type biogenesis protein CcmH/NrfF
MIDGPQMNRPNCHSQRVWNLVAEESLFVSGARSCHSEERVAHLAHRGSLARRGICFSLFALMLAANFLTAPLFAQAPVQSADRAKTLGNQLMCTCGCGDTAGSCSHPGAAFSGPCEVAKAKLKEMNERIGRGESDKTILQAFVGEYGESALAAPPARGLNWFAYTFPAVAFAIGLVLVIMIIRVWRHRPQVAPASGPAVSPEMLEHARRQIERDVQDD